jgi:hypothetical protein
VESLQKEQITQLRIVACFRCADCRTTFEPPEDALSASTHPHIGDLVVRQRRQGDGFVITLLGASASQETRCANWAQAVSVAMHTAGRLRSNVWHTENGVTFDLLANYRV